MYDAAVEVCKFISKNHIVRLEYFHEKKMHFMQVLYSDISEIYHVSKRIYIVRDIRTSNSVVTN